MPLYFFHVYDDAVTLDEDGQELPDVTAAKLEAVRGARSLASEQVMDGRLNLNHWIDVEDERGENVAVVAFGDAILLEL